MHPSRRRKKRPNYGIRTVEVIRGPNGFGFTISGQQPCILSCIVNNSPADQAGLRAGDFLISVNGVSVSKMAHDAVVSLIGNCVGPIKMTIAENYYSDSSDEEFEYGRVASSRKPKFTYKPRTHRLSKGDHPEKNVTKVRESISKHVSNESRLNANVFNEEPINDHSNDPNVVPMDDEAGPIEYKVLVGYLGTIEMPKQLLPNSRLQTVCSCIRKLRQEKRTPTTILMTILPTCLTLKNDSNHILAIYPTNRVVYVGSTTDRESRYFGLVTSAVCDTRNDSLQKRYGENFWQLDEKKSNNLESEIEISNSCHVFVTDPKLVNHSVHVRKAESFKIVCTSDIVTGSCLEFPINALYIVSLIQNLYKLQSEATLRQEANNLPVVANSPQPSASSNSDSGIGFRDDCGNISDRILVVEFPKHRPLPILNNNNRPQCIEVSNANLEALGLSLNNENSQLFELNNIRSQNVLIERQINVLRNDNGIEMKHLNNLNNVRACEGGIIKNNIEKPESYLAKQNNDGSSEYNRLTCRAILDPSVKSNLSSACEVETCQSFSERPVDVPDEIYLHPIEDFDIKSSTDNISIQSSKSNELNNLMHVFCVPSETKKNRRVQKMGISCDNLDKYTEKEKNKDYKLGSIGCRPNFSCEELNNLDPVDKFGYGSLQDLCKWTLNSPTRKHIAQSEPDVRLQRPEEYKMCDQNGNAKCSSSDGPASWATSFEKLLEDPLGLQAFAEFLKKEFSAENIYFWTACERFRKLQPGSERTAEAFRIYQHHLNVGAPEAVNVDSHGRQCTEQSLNNPEADLFDQPQKQIFNLMKFDSYPRFLKSDIYKQCLAGRLDQRPLDTRLNLYFSGPPTPTKLKKSLSNAEDRRRKSLLRWHRKNRSKSKDRSESESLSRQHDIITSNENIMSQSVMGGGEIHSSRSSLTSLDLAVVNQDLPIDVSTETRTALCRVRLSNGSTTVVQIKDVETIQQLVTRLLDKRGLTYSSFEVTTNKHPKALDINDPSSKLAGCEVTVEQRVVFKLDLPNRKIISVKSKYTKIIIDVLRPILHKYQYNLDQVTVTNANKPLDMTQSVTSIDGVRLNIQLKKEEQLPTTSNIRADSAKSKLEEITNKVFEGILQEKSDIGVFKSTRSDKGSVKSEDWGSEHSSGVFGKFLRRDSAVHERKKKLLGPKINLKAHSGNVSGDDVINNDSQVKKPLIAKWKTGASKFHVSTCSESDELVEGLTRAQRRLEDQRGTEINFELPDFLKDKENEQRNLRHQPFHGKSKSESHSAYTRERPTAQKTERVISSKNIRLDAQSNYENRNVMLSKETSTIKNSQSECDESETNSPVKSSTPPNLVGGSKTTRSLDPPPLPPKPKIIPIKPPNWGFYKAKELAGDRNQALFLEQPSSSFV